MFNSSAFGNGFLNGSNAVDTPTRSKNAEGRRVQNVTPVCVRQIRDCPGEEFTLFGIKSQILTLVCIFREIEVTSTKATYKLEDHTGTISAVLWLESDGDKDVILPPVKEGRYLRIYGSMRVTNGVKSILALRIMPIRNVNEIASHLLEVIHTRLATEKMSKEMNDPTTIAQNNPGAELVNSMSMMNASTSAGNNFGPMQQKVFKIVQVDESMDGVQRMSILSQFPQGQHKDVEKAIIDLASEGHIYTTIDDHHFKATD